MHVRGINEKVLEEFRECVKRKYGKKYCYGFGSRGGTTRIYRAAKRRRGWREYFLNLSTLFELTGDSFLRRGGRLSYVT